MRYLSCIRYYLMAGVGFTYIVAIRGGYTKEELDGQAKYYGCFACYELSKNQVREWPKDGTLPKNIRIKRVRRKTV